MNCKTVQHYCEYYLEGLLHSRIAESIEGHISRCGKCADEYETQRRMRESLRGMANVSRPERFWTELEGDIAARLAESREGAVFDDKAYDGGRSPHFRHRFAAAAVILALILSGMIWDAFYHASNEPLMVKAGGNGEEIEFYLEEHDLAQGINAISQSAFAGVVIQANNGSKPGGGR